MKCLNCLIFFVLIAGSLSSDLPVIIWHGMGDHAKGAGIEELADSIRKLKPGIKVKCISTGKSDYEDIKDTYLKPINEQLEEVCKQLHSDSDFSNGVHMIGLSQGGLFVRALAQRCNFEQLGAVISIGGPQMGVYGIPKCRDIGKLHFCHFMEWMLSFEVYSDFIQNHLVQAQYWHDPTDEEKFKKKSRFLADINQENKVNSTYRDNLLKVKALVLVRFLKDTILKPGESEWFGYYNEMSTEEMHTLQESKLYKEDRLGLKKLADTNRLYFLQVDNDHLHFSLEWFENEIVKQFIV